MLTKVDTETVNTKPRVKSAYVSSVASLNVSSPMVFGFKRRIIKLGISIDILKLALQVYLNPVVAVKVLNQVLNKRRRIHGNPKMLRYVRSGARYYWAVNLPGWPSEAFKSFIKGEFNKLKPFRAEKGQLQTMIFAITNRCPLKCEHCYEWNNLDSEELLSLESLKIILKKIQERGIFHVQLSGGEPLIRLNEMIALMKSAKPAIDFWILTSGFGLTYEKAVRMKRAGLVGTNISLDHWNENAHNEFRKNKKSYFWVREAVMNCRKVDLLVSLSLCATRSFVTEENLWKYIQLAKDWGAGFIRILEPRKVGRYANKNVRLKQKQLEILEDFYLKLNSDPKYFDYPIVMYPGYHQRKIGCFGAGNRYLYVDSNGDLHACPFCQQKVGNALNDSLDQAIQRMKKIGCHVFKTNYND